jgi:hypothetical protein
VEERRWRRGGGGEEVEERRWRRGGCNEKGCEEEGREEKRRENERRDEKRKEGEGDERGGIVVCFYMLCVIYSVTFSLPSLSCVVGYG